MFNSFYVRLNLLDDPSLPLSLLSWATALIDLLCQFLNVPLGVQQVMVVRVIVWSVFEQVLDQKRHMRHMLISLHISFVSINAGERLPQCTEGRLLYFETVHLNQQLVSRDPLDRFNHQIAQRLLLLVLTHALLLEWRREEDRGRAWI